MDKDVAINILEDVKQSLYRENGKQKGLSTVTQYIKGLQIAENKEIHQLIVKQQEYIKKYGENGRKTIKLNKKIDEKMQKIFNSQLSSLSSTIVSKSLKEQLRAVQNPSRYL